MRCSHANSSGSSWEVQRRYPDGCMSFISASELPILWSLALLGVWTFGSNTVRFCAGKRRRPEAIHELEQLQSANHYQQFSHASEHHSPIGCAACFGSSVSRIQLHQH